MVDYANNRSGSTTGSRPGSAEHFLILERVITVDVSRKQDRHAIAKFRVQPVSQAWPTSDDPRLPSRWAMR